MMRKFWLWLKIWQNRKPEDSVKIAQTILHSFIEKLKRLLDCAGDDDECHEMLKDTVSKCDTCQSLLYCRFTHGSNIQWDSCLHELEPGVWYLHVIDHFTSFSAASIVTAKKPKEIVKHFTHCWIRVHGPPHRLFRDNGAEFNFKEKKDLAEKFNTELKGDILYFYSTS